MKTNYDVVVIGAGPAGGQAARDLAKKGHQVLLVEKFKSFRENNFSSAGMTLEPLDEFGIPDSVIGTDWKNLVIQCSKNEYRWESNQTKGVVLDFGRLKQFLADEADKFGADLVLGHKYHKKRITNNGIEADLIDSATNETKTVSAKLLIDATGPLRRVMFEPNEEQPEMATATGIEYQIKVDSEIYNKYKDDLFFFLGDKWAYKGYSWIFPMEDGVLKVGAGKVNLPSYRDDIKETTIKDVTLDIIHNFIGTTDYETLDIHGGILRYSPKLKDIFYKDKVVAVGDCVSAVNPLGGEGIQYALKSGASAANYIDTYLKKGKANFKRYRKDWMKEFAFRWRICEFLTRRCYLKYDDQKVEERTAFMHSKFNIDQIIDMLFHYKFNNMRGRIFKMVLYKLTGKI